MRSLHLYKNYACTYCFNNLLTGLQLCLNFYILHTFYTLPENLNTQTRSVHMLQISELIVSLTQITKQDHKIHNVDDKFTITYSCIILLRFWKHNPEVQQNQVKVFQNFLFQNSIFKDMMLCHWVISSQHSFKKQEPLNDTECCKNLKFHNFLSIKKFISNTHMHQWHGWTCRWPKCPRDIGWRQIPLLLFPPYFRSFHVFEKGSLHESINNKYMTTWKEITYKCGPKQFQNFDKFCKMCVL